MMTKNTIKNFYKTSKKQYVYSGKVVLPLFHKHEAKIDTLASSAQVTYSTLKSEREETNKIFRRKLRNCCSKLWKGASKNKFLASFVNAVNWLLSCICKLQRRFQNIQNIHRFSIAIGFKSQWLKKMCSLPSSTQPLPLQTPPLRELHQSLPRPQLGQASLSSRSFPKHEPSPSELSSSLSWPLPLQA